MRSGFFYFIRSNKVSKSAAVSFADVESANIVGYQQVEIPAQTLTMIGVMFDNVSGGGLSVQDIFPDPLNQKDAEGNPLLTAAAGSGSADQLQYWDPTETGSYVTLYLNSNTGTSDALKARNGKWCIATRVPKDKSWGTAVNGPSAKILTSGMGLWLKRQNATKAITLTMAGAVVTSPEGRSYTCREGLTMIAGGFTTPFAPNPDTAGVGEAFDWLKNTECCAGAGSGTADQIQFWDPTETGSYVTLYLNSNTGTSDTLKARHNHWCVATRVPKDKTWGTAVNAPSPKIIPAGRGFWYKRMSGKGAFTFTLPQPYTLD